MKIKRANKFYQYLNSAIYILVVLITVIINKNSPYQAVGPRWIILCLSSVILPLVTFFYLRNNKKIEISFSLYQILLISFFLWFSISGLWTIDKANYYEQLINLTSFDLHLSSSSKFLSSFESLYFLAFFS